MIEVKKDDFVGALKSVAPFAGNGSLAVLSSVRIRVENGNVSLETTDLTSRSVAECAATGDDVFTACVDAKRLLSVASMAPGEILHIAYDDHRLTIESGAYQCSIQGMIADEFPGFDASEETAKILLLSEQLVSIIAKGGFAASDDVSRQVLCGVDFNANAGRLCVTSTDGHRLGRCSSLCGGDDCRFVLPAQAVARIARVARGEEMEICVGEKHVAFKFSGLSVYVKNENLKYPDVDKVIPKNY